MLELVSTIFNSLLTKDSGFLDLFKGKEKKLQEFQIALVKSLEQANIRQIEVNKIEASHENIFVSGWRPSVGWICSFSLAYNFILQPLLLLIFQAFKLEIVPPVLDMQQLITIIFSLLGMGGIRTYEKIKLNKNV